MKINVDSKNIYDFAEIMSLISHEFGLVGMDWSNVQGVFNCNDEMSFNVVEDDTPLTACVKLKAMLPAEKIKSGLIFFSVNEKTLELNGNEIEPSLTELANCVLEEDRNLIWNVYETEQEENCKIYFFRGDKTL